MGGRLTRFVIFVLGALLALGGLAILLFSGSIDTADRTASLLAAILALAVAAYTLFAEVRGRALRRNQVSPPDLRTEDDFVRAWIDLEKLLREVASISSERSDAVPLKAVIRDYENLPEVTESDVKDLLLLLKIRNGIMHPSIATGTGTGRRSDTRAIADAMDRQIVKLQGLRRGG